jgi:hypothetical protein
MGKKRKEIVLLEIKLSSEKKTGGSKCSTIRYLPSPTIVSVIFNQKKGLKNKANHPLVHKGQVF